MRDEVGGSRQVTSRTDERSLTQTRTLRSCPRRKQARGFAEPRKSDGECCHQTGPPGRAFVACWLVPLNTWWVSEPSQRYWMEITDREDIGGPLLSPKLPRLTWGYDLVSQVQPGDRVLHWHTAGGASAIVGWSNVAEHATVIPEYTWTPHGEERTTQGGVRSSVAFTRCQFR